MTEAITDAPTLSSAVESAFKTEAPARAVGEDRIRIRAYELYEKRAGKDGDAESDWYQAEAELKAETSETVK